MTRDEAILSCKALVHFHAQKIFVNAPPSAVPVPMDDLVQIGWVAVLNAYERWNPGSSKLNTFANLRVRGAMLDHLRTHDHLSRGHRNEMADGDPLSMLPCSLSESLSSDEPAEIGDFIASQDLSPLDLVMLQQDYERLDATLPSLSPAERLTVDLVYAREMTGIEAAAIRGVGESEVAERKRKALIRLRAAFGVSR